MSKYQLHSLFGRCYPVINCLFWKRYKHQFIRGSRLLQLNRYCKSAKLLVSECGKMPSCWYLNVQKCHSVGI